MVRVTEGYSKKKINSSVLRVAPRRKKDKGAPELMKTRRAGRSTASPTGEETIRATPPVHKKKKKKMRNSQDGKKWL